MPPKIFVLLLPGAGATVETGLFIVIERVGFVRKIMSALYFSNDAISL